MNALLNVNDLSVRFGTHAVVDGVSFAMFPGSALGIVGASGSGKSQCALALLGLQPPHARVSGSVCFAGEELVGASERSLNRIRGAQIAMVFQNPVASLNPHLRIDVQMVESLQRHRGFGWREAVAECRRMLDAVRVPAAERRLRQYPHELSGGLCQRIAIAAALTCQPRLLIADEPTTALDMTVQAQLLALLAQLRQEFGLALLLISHDLGAVAEVCDSVLVMQRGAVVERGNVDAVLAHPSHPCTMELLQARCALQQTILRKEMSA